MDAAKSNELPMNLTVRIHKKEQSLGYFADCSLWHHIIEANG